MAITTLVPWFGSARLMAENVGKLLDGCSWVGCPFAGGMSELRHIKARTVLVSDLHRHVINLARVAADETCGPILREELAAVPFHPDVLAEAQSFCQQRESDGYKHWSITAARHYFVASWMSRNGKAGTDEEFTAGLSVRWEAGGGDSATRYRNAVESLKEWQTVLARCTFVCLDVFDFLAKAKDRDGHGLYLDPPFPDAGADYKHKFSDDDHRTLAAVLMAFKRCRVVCRFHDHELIRELYPEPLWTWHRFVGRTQANKAAPEVLLTRNL